MVLTEKLVFKIETIVKHNKKKVLQNVNNIENATNYEFQIYN